MPVDIPPYYVASPTATSPQLSTPTAAASASPTPSSESAGAGSFPPHEYPLATLRLGAGVGAGTSGGVAGTLLLINDWWPIRYVGLGAEGIVSGSETMNPFAPDASDWQHALRGRLTGRVMLGRRIGLQLAASVGIGSYSITTVEDCSNVNNPLCFDGSPDNEPEEYSHGEHSGLSAGAELAFSIRFRGADFVLTARADATGEVISGTFGPGVAFHL